MLFFRLAMVCVGCAVYVICIIRPVIGSYIVGLSFLSFTCWPL